MTAHGTLRTTRRDQTIVTRFQRYGAARHACTAVRVDFGWLHYAAWTSNPWPTRRPSNRVEIVESCAGKEDPLTLEGNRLRFEQTPLAGSLCERAVCANDAMPWRLARVGVAQHVARQAWRAR